MTRILKRHPIIFILIGIIVLANSSMHPVSNGGYTGAPGDSVCAQCHNDTNMALDGEIIIDGIPSTIDLGEAYDVTITVTNTNLNASRAGFQLTALNSSNSKSGNFTESDPNASLRTSAGKQYFGHAPAVQFNGNGSVSWQATWTAPTTGSGDITFYCSSILGNGASGSDNDRFLITNLSTTIASSPLSVNITNVNNVSCYDGNDGSATAVPTGGSSPYEYEWSNGETTATANNLPAGTAMVIVTDNSGNTASAIANINEPSEMVITTNNINDPSCFNSFDGNISISVSGGNPPYSYDWSNGGSASQITNLGPGTFTVLITDNNDCVKESEFILEAPPAIVLENSVLQHVSCFGQSNGSITIDVSGGIGQLSFNWSNGSNQQNLSNIPAGNYSVEIFDNNNCILEENFTITQPTQLNSNININNLIICNGNNTGSLTASGSGGTTPYNYLWSTGSTSNTINNLVANNYTVTVTDNKGCISTKSQVLSNPAILVSSLISSNNASCPGINDGAASISISGGLPPYSTEWSNGATGTAVNNLPSGNNSYEITDILGCVLTGSVSIGSNQLAVLIEDEVINPTCFGSNNGSISIETINAADYNIIWSNGLTGNSIANLSPGFYSVQASNIQGCVSNELEFEIVEPQLISVLEENIENVRCFGEASGNINIDFVGGTGDLTYLWNTGDTTNIIDSLNIGQYTVIVTDENSCTASKNFSITQPAQITVDSFELQNLLCFNRTDGYVEINTSGGTGNLQAVWSNGDIGFVADSLVLGLVSVVITDNENCNVYDTFNITSPAPMIITSEVINESGVGLNDGSVTLNVINGNDPFQYLWSNGDTTSVIDSLAPGLYTVIVSDSLGCEQFGQYNVQSGNCALAATHEVVNVSCFGGNDGQVLFNLANGLEPYTITPNPDSLSVGTYSFEIADSNNCSISITNIQISQPEVLHIKLDTIIAASSAIKDDGEIRITITGGTNPYQYLWMDSLGNAIDSVEDIGNLLPGVYNINIVDANECSIGSIDFEVGFISNVIENNNGYVKVYPNPVLDFLYVENTMNKSTLQIFDLNGKLLINQTIDTQLNTIDVSNLINGIYILRISNGKIINTTRINVE